MVLAILGAIVTILWLLHRLAEMGIDLGGLNPFLWQRRRKWQHAYEANPIFKLDDPMEVTALLIVATAKADGELSSEEKQEILSIFEREFGLGRRQAAELLIASSHLLGRGEEVRNNLQDVLAPSAQRFTREQALSAIGLVSRVAEIGSAPNELKLEQAQRIDELLRPAEASAGPWDANKSVRR